MTEPPCSACGCAAHWHRKYSPGPGAIREWKPQDGKRGMCTAFLDERNVRGFRKRCRCKQYRVSKEKRGLLLTTKGEARSRAQTVAQLGGAA
jgi:hypothetical protein